jgi:carbonic anhydrase/acetyltransferase-like protein (isoleucine patch superfamily)
VHSLALIGSLGDSAPRIHPTAWVAPGAVVVGDVELGPEASVWYGAVLRADEAPIVVGAGGNIQDGCCVHVNPGEPAVLEDGVSLGHGAVVHGAHVETGALVGMGAIVLGRARIGAGSLIAAGAVVAPDTVVPAGVLVAGVPGRVIRELTDGDRQVFAGTAARYAARARRHAAAVWSSGGADGAPLDGPAIAAAAVGLPADRAVGATPPPDAAAEPCSRQNRSFLNPPITG